MLTVHQHERKFFIKSSTLLNPVGRKCVSIFNNENKYFFLNFFLLKVPINWFSFQTGIRDRKTVILVHPSLPSLKHQQNAIDF